MIVNELEERGLHEEARRRLATWLKYQGTMGLRVTSAITTVCSTAPAGFECGETYDQHHGWVLWRLAEQLLHDQDDCLVEEQRRLAGPRARTGSSGSAA